MDNSIYQENWHHRIIAEHLEMLLKRQIKNLLVLVPPSTGKSLQCSVSFPTYAWTEIPRLKIIGASYGDPALRDARRHRKVVMSRWYQERWPNGTRIPFKNTHAASNFVNEAMGFRFSTTTGGGLTGQHADIAILDDLNKAQDAFETGTDMRAGFEKSWMFFHVALPTRFVDPVNFCKMMIAQRLHEEDVPGRWFKLDPDIVVLCFPMEYDPKHEHVCKYDIRTGAGELLWPERFPREVVETLKRDMGSMHAAAQLQQSPSPAGGAILKRAWFENYYRTIPHGLQWLQSWDLAFKGHKTSDPVAGQVWAYDRSSAYLADEIQGVMSFTESKAAIRQMTRLWPQANLKIIEDAANASAIEDDLKREIPGIVLQSAGKGGLYGRVEATACNWEARNVFLPHPDKAPWVKDFIEEHCRYKGGKNDTDDRVSASSLAHVRIFQGSGNRFRRAMMAYRGES
jgi:predicted phage terminase large subunit-like protein